MHDTLKNLLLGTLLAAITGGIAYWDLPAFDMEPGSDSSQGWFLIGFPFIIALIFTHVLGLPYPWVLAWLIHWAFCVLVVSPVLFVGWSVFATVREGRGPMTDTNRILLLGTLLAAITMALGLYGVSGWQPGPKGAWGGGNAVGILLGLTFVLPLLVTESYVLAAVINWVICTLLVWPVFVLVRFLRRRTPGSADSRE